MLILPSLITQIQVELIRLLTGKLFTEDQISQITSHTVGKYFADFFPSTEQNVESAKRIEIAKHHINEAGLIIKDMQCELQSQSNHLDVLLRDIDDKKKLAEKYAELANTNKEKFSAFKDEMSQVLRSELEDQANKNKTLRKIASFLIWLFTLLIGAALGTYFKDIINLLS